mmetsp:Transcript_3009/g.4069  ORF Transcript_3009/g.4069 Transcript_3009/m.4069 type:complete len:469 (+) Transcript_3009:16-1422(+)
MAPLKVLIGSWNVNACSPKGSGKGLVDLSNWLCKSEEAPGIIAVALQEIVPLTDVTNYASSKQSNQTAEDWRHLISETLRHHPKYRNVSYQTLEVHNLVGMMTVVLVQSCLFNRISNVRVGNSVGRKGLGNKGGVSVRFDFSMNDESSKSMCFIGVHLTAHQENIEKRNQDIDAILRRTVWNKIVPGDRNSLTREQLSILSHDVVFLFGDYNYRIEKVPGAKVVEMVNSDQYTRLINPTHDQLLKERSRKRILSGFQEGEINFRPTFKYIPGTNDYLTKKGKKERIPSWCDRILWKTSKTVEMEQLSYFTNMNLVVSDHKPVGAEFVFPGISQTAMYKREESEEASEVIAHGSPSFGNGSGTTLVQAVSSLENYNSTDPLKLSLKKGDVIDVLSEDMLSTDGTNGWHLGRCKRTGKLGYFNSHFCKLLGVMQTELNHDAMEMADKMRALSYHRHVMEMAALNEDNDFF